MKIRQNVNDKENIHMQRGALTIQKTYFGFFFENSLLFIDHKT